MNRRLKLEKWVHGRIGTSYEDCHCYEKLGLFRKNTPLGRCGNQRCVVCYWDRYDARRENKRMRRQSILIEAY